jgi:DNA methylase
VEPIYDSPYAGRDLSNFIQNLQLPRHRWYEFKEGFSQALVQEAIDGSSTKRRRLSILDPFAGSGTTLVTAGTLGHAATGVEVNPFLAFTASAKCVPGGWRERDFRIALGKLLAASANECKSPLEGQSTFTEREGLSKWLFNRSVLRGYTALDLSLRQRRRFRAPLRLALLGALLDCCNARRDGKCLRYRTGWETEGLSSADLRRAFRERAQVIFNDVSAKPFHAEGVNVIQGDARSRIGELPDQSFDLMITSPPYLNSFDYSDVYRPELFAGGFVGSNADLRAVRLQTIRSHVQVEWEPPEGSASPMLPPLIERLSAERGHLWSRRLPEMVQAYFLDMAHVLGEAVKKVRRGGEAWIVVSTSAYAGVEIPVDLILADVATRNGWNLKDVYVMRQLRAAGQHWAHLESGAKPPLRESLIVLERR